MRKYKEPEKSGAGTAKHILCDICIKDYMYPRSYTYIILGKSGPTGKSWLCDQLKQRGYTAIEITGSVNLYVEYSDDSNSLVIDPEHNTVTIILNESLPIHIMNSPSKPIVSEDRIKAIEKELRNADSALELARAELELIREGRI